MRLFQVGKIQQLSGRLDFKISDYMKVPEFGCYKDIRVIQIQDIDSCIEKIWRIGGQTGWYYANWLWKIRGFIDKVLGGVGFDEAERI